MNNVYLQSQKDWHLPVVPISDEMNPFAYLRVKLWGILGFRLPYGTLKIFAVLSLLKHAKETGKLKGVKTLVESTSGAFGLALTQIAPDREFGVPNVCLILKEEVPDGKRYPLIHAGAEVMKPLPDLSPIATARKMGGGGFQADGKWEMAEDGIFNLDQYGCPANSWLYRDEAGPKILQQMPMGFKLFVSPVGTGGSIIGLSEAFRKREDELTMIGVMAGPGQDIPALRKLTDMDEIRLPWRKSINKLVEVQSIPSYLATLQIQRHTGMMVGITGGATYVAALMAIREYEETGTLDSLRSKDGMVNVLITVHDGFRAYGVSKLPIPDEYQGKNAPMPWKLLW